MVVPNKKKIEKILEKITKSPCENAPNFNAFRGIMNDKFYFNRLETSESILKVQSGKL